MSLGTNYFVRLAVAVLVAPLGAPVALILGKAVEFGLTPRGDSERTVFAMFATPAPYAVFLLVGIPIHLILNRMHIHSLRAYLVAGTAILVLFVGWFAHIVPHPLDSGDFAELWMVALPIYAAILIAWTIVEGTRRGA